MEKPRVFTIVVATLLLLLGGWGAIGLILLSSGQLSTPAIGAAGLLAAGTIMAGLGLKRSCNGSPSPSGSGAIPGGGDMRPEGGSAGIFHLAESLQSLSRRIEEASHIVVSAAEAQANCAIDTANSVNDINGQITMTSEQMESLTDTSSNISSSTHEMALTIREVSQNMEHLLNATNGVNLAAERLALTIHAIDDSVEQLNQTSQSTASSIMQMDATMHEVEENVRATAAISTDVLHDAEGGKIAVDEAISGIQEIQRASAVTAEVMENLSQRARDIGSILSVIDEVAGRTNLLALNASIIAAKAGEHGSAFAVVAEEIKKLAHKTKESTREITALVEGVQNETERAVRALEQTEKSIGDGVKRSRQSGESLDKIVGGIRRFTEQIAMIARASGEQTHGIDDIRRSMERMTTMLVQIVKASGEQTVASDEIAAAISEMRGLTTQVQTATHEQSCVGSQIADSAAHMLKVAHETLSICHEQQSESNRISASVEEILASTDRNLDIARSLDEMLIELQRHVTELKGMAQTPEQEGQN